MYPKGKSEEGQFLFSDVAHCGSNLLSSLEKKVIIVQDIALSAPSSPSDLITIAFLAAKQLSFKEKTGLLSRNPMTWWLRDSWYEGKEGLVPLGLSNSLFLPR